MVTEWSQSIEPFSRTAISHCEEIKPVNPKGNQSWVFIGKTEIETETPILWPPDVKNWLIGQKKTLMLGKTECRRRDRGWDDWIASLTWWTWVWVNSGNWWWTGRPGVLQLMGLQRVGHDWATEMNWMAESEEELKSLLMRVKGGNGKAGLNSTLKKLSSWDPVPSLHS